MRLRKKPWAKAALQACDFFVDAPCDNIGKWHTVFDKPQEIWLELGCGKGGFISKLATRHLDKNFIAIDIKDEVLILAKEKIEKEYDEINAKTGNIRLMSHEIMLIHRMLNGQDVVNRIYINFCNPWHKNSRRPQRLTHPNQLNQYKTFLAPDGEVWFKTDDDLFFEDSIKYFEQTGFKITYLTYDLHESGELHRNGFEHNIETEHEKMYIETGCKIKFLIARQQCNRSKTAEKLF